MKIAPWIPLIFGVFGFPVACIAFVNVVAELLSVPTRASGHLHDPVLASGIFLSGNTLGASTTAALLRMRAGRRGRARTVAVCSGIGHCALFAGLWQIGGGGRLDGMTVLALVLPLYWCFGLFLFAVLAKNKKLESSVIYPPIVAP